MTLSRPSHLDALVLGVTTIASSNSSSAAAKVSQIESMPIVVKTRIAEHVFYTNRRIGPAGLVTLAYTSPLWFTPALEVAIRLANCFCTIYWSAEVGDALIYLPYGPPIGYIAMTSFTDPPCSFILLHADPYVVSEFPAVKDAYCVVTAMSVPYKALHGTIYVLRHQDSRLLTFSAMGLPPFLTSLHLYPNRKDNRGEWADLVAKNVHYLFLR
ncbi:hypothetical protein GGF32_007101 [Allomyces javanicus]|nr:hypothetical protein GGF32_007101 [Allomyces javanicus]